MSKGRYGSSHAGELRQAGVTPHHRGRDQRRSQKHHEHADREQQQKRAPKRLRAAKRSPETPLADSTINLKRAGCMGNLGTAWNAG